MDASNTVAIITNLSASALQGLILWYLIVKAIPNIVADFRAEIAAERQHCAEELAKADERAMAMLDAVKPRGGVNATP